MQSPSLIEDTGYHGQVDVLTGSYVRGWCCARSGATCAVYIIVNGILRAIIPAITPREDLKKRGFCDHGGGFELDISGFLSFGLNSVLIKDPAGIPLARGEASLDFRDVIQADLKHPFMESPSKKIGLYGNRYLASDPKAGSVTGKMLYALGIKTSKGEDGDEDCSLWFSHPHLDKPSNVERFINARFSDISKSGIDKAHKAVFGRTVCIEWEDIQPDQRYVLKSESNAAHDGRIVLGTELLEMKDPPTGAVVQRVIDNSYSETEVYDIRVPVIGNTIPFVYIKTRSVNIRFSNANRTATITAVNNVLTPAEIRQIVEFCRTVGADYCELDVLRDAASGDIWVVDVNNTPSGPPNGLTKSAVIFSIREMAITFYKEFISPGRYWGAQ